MKENYLFLGYGYVGKALDEHLKSHFPQTKVFKTSRREKKDFIQFDFNNKLSWENIPEVDRVIWSFPPKNPQLTKQFLTFLKPKTKNIVVIGTTSSFKVSQEDEMVNELTVFDLESERAASEWCLKELGCRMVMSAGIYGPGRNPIEWVRSGRVGKSQKFVNMIHQSDLTKAILAAFEFGRDGEIYIASDGNPQRWSEVITFWENKGLTFDVPNKESNKLSKRIDSSGTMRKLGWDPEFRNFQEAVFLMNQPSSK